MTHKNTINNLRKYITAFVVLLFAAAHGYAIEITGTLRNTDGEEISGVVTIIEKGSPLTIRNYRVDDTGYFRVHGDASKGIVVHARAPNHASQEKLISPRTSDLEDLNFTLPVEQIVEGRVIDYNRNGVPGAALRVRYHEPNDPIRSVAFDDEEITDGDGRFKINVGVGTPFVIDVHSPNYVSATSQQFQIEKGIHRSLEDIVLSDIGATVIAVLIDQYESPVVGIPVLLIADPNGISDVARGSWMHHRSFRQRSVTSNLGNVRFSGVPAGRIIVLVRGSQGVIEERSTVYVGQELRLEIRLP